MEEINRQKYIILKNELYKIIEKIDSVNDTHIKLNTSLNKSLLIDNKIVEKELFDSIYKENNKIEAEIRNIITTINNM